MSLHDQILPMPPPDDLIRSSMPVSEMITGTGGVEVVVRDQSFLVATRIRALDDVPRIRDEAANG
jgi:hypothetical protein